MLEILHSSFYFDNKKNYKKLIQKLVGNKKIK